MVKMGEEKVSNKTPTIYMHLAGLGAPAYHRIITPFQVLSKVGCNVNLITALKPEYLEDGDIFVFQQVAEVFTLEFCEVARRRGKVFVFDLEEFLTDVFVDHPYYRTLYQTQGFVRSILRSASLVTTPSRFLASQLKRYNPQVSFVPSYLEDNQWLERDKGAKPKHGLSFAEVTVGWVGNEAQVDDLAILAPIFEELVREFPSVRFVFLGYKPTFLEIPEERVLVLNYERFSQYQHLLDLLDIAVLPLKPFYFNLANSGSRVLELGAKGVPVVASNLGAYRDFSEAGAPILLASNKNEWQNHLFKLVKDEEEREKQGQLMQKFVKENYLADGREEEIAQLYLAAWEGARDGSR